MIKDMTDEYNIKIDDLAAITLMNSVTYLSEKFGGKDLTSDEYDQHIQAANKWVIDNIKCLSNTDLNDIQSCIVSSISNIVDLFSDLLPAAMDISDELVKQGILTLTPLNIRKNLNVYLNALSHKYKWINNVVEETSDEKIKLKEFFNKHKIDVNPVTIQRETGWFEQRKILYVAGAIKILESNIKRGGNSGMNVLLRAKVMAKY